MNQKGGGQLSKGEEVGEKEADDEEEEEKRGRTKRSDKPRKFYFGLTFNL